jgi:hypothetical protein
MSCLYDDSAVYSSHQNCKSINERLTASAKPETAGENDFGGRRYWYHFPALALILFALDAIVGDRRVKILQSAASAIQSYFI